MLHDTVDRVVDRDAALEFMKEATKLASVTELEDIGERLEAKCALFGSLLAEDRVGSLDEAGLERLVGSVFSLRRKAGRLLRANGLDTLRDEVARLIYGADTLAARFDRFVGAVQGVDRSMSISLASEALHFLAPDRYWLWTHWIWNPAAGTGALPLVTREGIDLDGGSPGAVYEKVGRALVHVNAQGHSVGFSRSGRGLFGTDVFLACVYAVYMYTVFRVKLSQEFNRILPDLPELVQRVLGVHRKKSQRGESADG